MSDELWCERVVQGGLGSFEDVNFRGAYIFHVSQIVKIFLRLSECLTMSVYDDFSAYLSVYFINKHGGLPMQHAKRSDIILPYLSLYIFCVADMTPSKTDKISTFH